jgi:hypothetical protein
MSAAARQDRFRKRIKEQGMVDIRVEIPVITRDRVKEVARARKSTMKAEIQKAIEDLSRTSML